MTNEELTSEQEDFVLEQEASDNISNCLALQKQKERGFKIE